MNEQHKGVHVDGATSSLNADYPNGTRIEIRDGHLIVMDNAASVIAIHAPGSWRAATVK